jgi:alpha-L-rhamnosidase
VIVRPARRLRRTALVVATAIALTLPLAGHAPSATAAKGSKPSAPTRLTVDDLAQPLDTDETPRFGWLPQDADANEVQTAYKIEVRDADGAIVWDTDKVKSDEQAYVEYGGEALAPGSVYEWRVRTWDKDHLPSPWSGWETFETGLGDDDWGDAEWIRRPPGNPDAGALSIVDGRGRVSGGDVTIAKPGRD